MLLFSRTACHHRNSERLAVALVTNTTVVSRPWLNLTVPLKSDTSCKFYLKMQKKPAAVGDPNAAMDIQSEMPT